MAFSLNKVMLIGNLGKDAETRFTNNNVSISNFSLATTSGYKGKDGNWVNETTWHNITAFSLSDFYKDALKKGKKFYVEGRIQKHEYTDKEGIKRYSVDVICEKIIPLSESARQDNQEHYTDRQESNSRPEEAPDVNVDDNSDLPF